MDINRTMYTNFYSKNISLNVEKCHWHELMSENSRYGPVCSDHGMLFAHGKEHEIATSWKCPRRWKPLYRNYIPSILGRDPETDVLPQFIKAEEGGRDQN